MQITLGFEPYDLKVVLAWGGGWYVELRVLPTVLPDGFPAGTAVYLEWHTSSDDTASPFVTWNAVVAGGSATFDKTPADVHSVLAAGASIARLHYTDENGHVFVWAGGRFQRK